MPAANTSRRPYPAQPGRDWLGPKPTHEGRAQRGLRVFSAGVCRSSGAQHRTANHGRVDALAIRPSPEIARLAYALRGHDLAGHSFVGLIRRRARLELCLVVQVFWSIAIAWPQEPWGVQAVVM